jgi:cytochrome bd ubiquinol oxidase subunit II
MTTFWVLALALTILLYVLLDGFDLGVGVLFLCSRSETNRSRMLAAIAPVWDGNETWLVLTGTILFGAFSRAYALVLSALYLPVIVGVLALVLRGVAFEFRAKATVSRAFWDAAFAVGSAVATFVQGAALGALAAGLPVRDGRYAGGVLGWVSPISLTSGVALVLGYALLGASWLITKSEGPVRESAYRSAQRVVLLGVPVVALLAWEGFHDHLPIMMRWKERPGLWVLLAIGVLALVGLLRGLQRRRDQWPYKFSFLLFGVLFLIVAGAFWPYMVPFSLTIAEAASPPSSGRFMFWGAGLVSLPLTLIYTVLVYRVFRGKTLQQGSYD